MKLQNPEKWPEDRKWRAVTGDSLTGVFVGYKTEMEPLAALGRSGDLWITSKSIFVKHAAASENVCQWTRWRKNLKFSCPYDERLSLVWSTGAHFKYLTDSSKRSESRRWVTNKG